MERIRNSALSRTGVRPGFIRAAGLLLFAATFSRGLFAGPIGRIETIGGTTYDQQFQGLAGPTIFYDSLHGVHAVWTYSESSDEFPDLNVRYNFWDASTGAWRFVSDRGFMSWGASAFPSGYGSGNLDVNPLTGCAYVGAGLSTQSWSPRVSRSVEPGSGVFQSSAGPADCCLPQISLGSHGEVHMAMTDDSSSALYYTDMAPWDAWSMPVYISPLTPSLQRPAYVIAASKSADNACIAWLAPNQGGPRVFLRRTIDGGGTWQESEMLPLPDAFHPGSESLIAGLDVFPFYDPDEEDEDDCLQVVGTICPMVGGVEMRSLAEIWHWTASQGWSRIARAGCDSALLAGRYLGGPRGLVRLALGPSAADYRTGRKEQMLPVRGRPDPA